MLGGSACKLSSPCALGVWQEQLGDVLMHHELWAQEWGDLLSSDELQHGSDELQRNSGELSVGRGLHEERKAMLRSRAAVGSR